MTPQFDAPEAFGWEIGPAGFPVQIEVTEAYVEPTVPYQGPVSPGFTPGPGAVYLAGGPAIPQQAEERYFYPAPGLPEAARIGEVAPVDVAPVLEMGILSGITGFITTLVADFAIDKALEYIAPSGGEAMPNGNGVGLYGHEGLVRNGGYVPVGGPGVPEPPRAMVAKQWKTKSFSHTAGEYWVHFFRLHDGRIMCYNAAKREWKMWRPKKPIVLYRGKITLSQAVRTQRMLDKLWKTVAKKTKALKLA